MKTSTGIVHNAGSKCLTARYLHATSVHPTDTWRIQKSIQTHTCHGIHHTGHRNVKVEFFSTDILPKVCTDRSIHPRQSRTILKTSTVLISATTRLIVPKNVPSNSSTVLMWKRMPISPNIAKRFNIRTPGALWNWKLIPQHNSSDVCSFALQQVKWDLLIAVLCLVLMVRI